MKNTIWTIGHSTRALEQFIHILKSHNIKGLADVRTLPGSRRYPHFNQEFLSVALEKEGIEYRHFLRLGGRKKPSKESVNTAWRNASFKGYADHMSSSEFAEGINELVQFGEGCNVAVMCSELVWWKCHRSLISDYLKVNGWEVIHIMDSDKIQTHPYSSPARVEQGKLFYN